MQDVGESLSILLVARNVLRPMSSHKPPPRTLVPEDDRKIQQFLERAAPVVLQRRVLDTQSWGELLALAEELELSDEQLRATVDDLKQRGVIENVDLSPPQPPPLPRDNGTNLDQAVTDAGRPETPEQEDDFSLTPPAPPPQATHEMVRLTEVERRKRFVDQARMIIGEQRGLGPKAQSLLTATAEELGLSEQQMREALKAVVHEPRAETEDEATHSSRWRIEGQPIPEPAPPKKKPSETYRHFVEKSLDKFARDGVVSVDLEDGILKHGTKVLRLSQVYARHLVQEAAEARQLRVASIDSVEARDQDEAAERDPHIARFGERAAPILAQHRGLNAKSRVLLAAVAAEIGLSEEQMENAIATFQQDTANGTGVDAIQRERLELFRIFLRNSMQRLPRALLTPNVEAAFIESGENLHGVAAELVRPTIREIADELQLSVITAGQSQQHIENLVQQKLGDAFVLKSDVRERIRSEGEQWGLAANQVDAIIRANTHSNYRRRRSEQNFTNLALFAAGVAVLLVIAFLGWAMLGGKMLPNELPVEPHAAEPLLSALIPQPGPDRDDSWWDDDLSIHAANVRIEFPLLRRTINDIASPDPARRAAAYKELVDHFFQRTAADLHRSIFLGLLASCYALDPNQETADALAQALLANVPGPEDRLSDAVELYPNVFWAVRVAVAALAEKSIADERAVQLSVPLGRLLGTSVDYQQDRRDLERACLGALAERLYRLLTSSIDSQPAAVDSLHRIISKEAARYLDAATLDKLNADFLVAVLGAAPSEWRRYEALLVDTIRSSDPLAVVRLVDLYESTTAAELQRFMGASLLQATGAPARALTVAEIAAEVRRSLGVTDDMQGGGRWLKFSRAANSELAKPRARPDKATELFQEITQLARLATLGCALAQHEPGQLAFDELHESPFSTAAEEVASAGSSKLRSVFTEFESRRLEISLKALTDSRAENSPAYRATRVKSLAGLAERVRYLPPGSASLLAQYLLQKKDNDNKEHLVVLSNLPALALWKNLRLAIADQLDGASLERAQLLELVTAMLADKPAGTSPDNQHLRVALLQSVHSDLSAEGSIGRRKAYDRGRQELLRFYKTQAELLGVPPTDYDEATRPSRILRAMIEHRAGLVDANSLPEELGRIVVDLPHQLTAIEYLATDDVRRTVLLERLWLQVLSLEAAGKNARTARDAVALVDELNQSERPAVEQDTPDLETLRPETMRLVAQLRDGQVALLRMWMLINKSN